MAVAVKNTPETISQRPGNRLAWESLVGAVFILGCLAVVFYALPKLWWELFRLPHNAVMTSLLILVMVGAAGGLIYLGRVRLKGGPTSEGLFSGIFVGLCSVLAIALVTLGIGNICEKMLGISEPAIGLGIMSAAALALGILAARYFFRPAFEKSLVRMDEQGWFSAQAYKKSQGQRVRRGTIVGLLLLGGTGIWSMYNRGILSGNWEVTIPFTHATVVLLPDLQFTVPFVLALAALWFAYRGVNFPTFADFLIATEAELNKVSWTTRKRLVQDTIVVLVTVVLLTLFLFVVDFIWAQVLTHIGVIQIAPSSGGPGGPTKIPY